MSQQFDTTPDYRPDTATYPTRTYVDMHGKPTTNHKTDKTPLQSLLDGLRAMMDELESWEHGDVQN